MRPLVRTAWWREAPLLWVALCLAAFFVGHSTYHAPYHALYPDLVSDDARGRSQGLSRAAYARRLGPAEFE